MARRYRFKPDANFEDTVILAASGVGFARRGRSSVRRRTTTLDFVADQIIEEAIAIATHHRGEDGLSQYDAEGNRDSDFRRSRSGRKYIKSFRKLVTREGGKLVFYVINDHPHAYEVEYGNGGGGRRTGSNSELGYYKIPITKKTYRRIRAQMKAKRQDPTFRQKNLMAAQQRLRYWENVKSQGANIAGQKAVVRRRFDMDRVQRSTRKAFEQISLAEREIARYDQPVDRPHAFVSVDERDGRAYLYTKNPRTYAGYGILTSAMKRITRRYLRD